MRNIGKQHWETSENMKKHANTGGKTWENPGKHGKKRETSENIGKTG